MEDNPYSNKELVAKQENEREAKSQGVDYADVDGKAQIKTAMKQAPKEPSTPVSVTNIGDLYTVVDKSQKKGAEKEKETVTNKEDLYAMPMKKKGRLTERGEGVM